MSAEVVQVGEETIVTETVEEVVEQIPPESTVPDEVHLTLDPEMPEEHGDIVAKPIEEVTEPAAEPTAETTPETTDAPAAEPVTDTVTESAAEPVAAPTESQTGVPEATAEATPAEGQVTMTTAKVEAEEKKDAPIEQTQGN